MRDPDLRDAILKEVKQLKSETEFGLVFAEHIPEVAAIYSAPIGPGWVVA